MSDGAELKHLHLIDGSGFLFRAYHGLPPMNRPDGTPVNAVYGFSGMLMSFLDRPEVEHVAVIFDAARTTFRNEIYPEYKAHRPPAPEDLVPQFALVREAVEAFGLPAIEMAGYEADDIIATYARQAAAAGAEVTIVSSDKDLMQLVGDGIRMIDAFKGERVIGPAQVAEKFGVGPEKVVDVQALAGDSTDNVPGVPGIGVKTAAQLITEYGDLDTLLDRAGEIRQPKRRENLLAYREQALVSRRLVRLKDDVPVELPLAGLIRAPSDAGRLATFLRAQNFASLLRRAEGRARGGPPAAARTSGPEEASGDVAGDAPGVAPGDAPEGAAEKTADATPGDAPAEQLAERPAEQFTEQPAPEYVLVEDEAALEAWIAEARAAGCVAVDAETTSRNPMRAELVGLSLSVTPGRACYVPVGHRTPGVQGALDLGGPDPAEVAPGQIPRDRALALLRPLLEDPAVLKVGQNVKYDMLVLKRYGVEMTPVDDTMLLSFVLEAGFGGHGLDRLAERHLGLETRKYADVAGTGKKQVTFDLVPLEAARDYAAEDADVALRLHQFLRPRLLAARRVALYETVERPLIPVLAAMESAGILVDKAALKALSAGFAGRIAEVERDIHALAGEEFTIASPQQLAGILYDKLGLPSGGKTRGGARSTDARVLEGLAEEGHELPGQVLEWRRVAKLKSTYSDALSEEINPATRRIHTSFNMTGAQTGRLASSNPNLQNIPVRTEEGRRIRSAFVADEGHRLVSFDYSQIELRILAHMAGVESLVEAFRAGRDIHAATAAEVFGVPEEGMDPLVRRQAKAINFGIIYGISAFGLARQLGVPRGEAQAYIESYFARYPGIRDYMESTVAHCRKEAWSETLFGRRIHFPEIAARSQARRAYAERQAINAPIQGTAADIIKRAMIRVPPALARAGLGARLLLQVHDELLFEVAEDEIEKTITTIREVMEDAARPVLELRVPLVVDAGTGENWAEAH